jgi:N-acyl-D-aspartate/D-glutamate deacylase
MPHDLVIRGGTIIDGSGAPGHTGDVAVDGDRLTQIGGRRGGQREIDATGLAVCPGFIDPHTHYDAQICWDHALTPCWNGDERRDGQLASRSRRKAGARPHHAHARARRGHEPARPAQRHHLGLGDVPQYLEAVAAMQPVLNVGSLFGHSALRYYVLDDAAAERAATQEEVARMQELLREGMRAGALGFSTSQAPTHFGGDGRPVPSRCAEDDEVIGLAAVLHEFGRGAVQITAKHLTDVDVSIEAARRSGRPVTFLGAIRPEATAKLNAARQRGLQLTPQTSCRPTMTDFKLSAMGIFEQLPSWSRVMQADKQDLPRVFADPAFRAAFRRDVTGEIEGYRLFKGDWDGVKVQLAEKPELEPLIGKSVAEIAAERGADPFDGVLRHRPRGRPPHGVQLLPRRRHAAGRASSTTTT